MFAVHRTEHRVRKRIDVICRGKGSGYQYAVHCYRGDERVLEFLFMTETIIKENVDDRTDRVFTAEQAIPAVPYIQRMFEEARARN